MRFSRRLFGFAIFVAAFVYLLGTIGSALAAENPFGPRPAPAPPPAVPFTDVNPYGANFFLEWEPEEWKIEKTFELAHAAGLGWVKQHFPWDSLQLSPGPNGYWDEHLNVSTWDKYDRIVSLAQKYNLQIIARLDRPPSWTRADNRRPEAPPDDDKLYGDFVYDVVSHFKGQIHYYQIWNEPNIYPEWGEQSPDPAAYTRLLQIAYQRAKEADPNVVILSAPLAQTTEDSSRNMSDVKFLQGMYAAGAKPYFDVLFANAYGFAYPPEDPPAPDRLNFRRVELLRQVMVQNGDGNKAIWFNEFGWDAAPATFAPTDLPWSRVTEEQQAQYTVDAIRYARAHWPWSGVFNIWYFRQILPQEDQPDYYFRMVDPGFTPRPIYNAVKQAATTQGVAAPGTYAMTDPAVSLSGAWGPVLAPRAVGGMEIASNTPGDSVTITFVGDGVNLYVQRSPNAGQVYVTVDGRATDQIDQRDQGRSILNLSGSGNDAPIEVPVADSLGPGEHVLRLVVGPTTGPEHGAVEVAGFEALTYSPLVAITRNGLRLALVGLIGIAGLVYSLGPGRRS